MRVVLCLQDVQKAVVFQLNLNLRTQNPRTQKDQIEGMHQNISTVAEATREMSQHQIIRSLRRVPIAIVLCIQAFQKVQNNRVRRDQFPQVPMLDLQKVWHPLLA